MIAVYEPLYLPDQKLREPCFRPFDVRHNPYPDWREFWIYVDIYRKKVNRVGAKCGLFSPKFRLKTGVEGRQFIEFAESHSDSDVCIINPFPQLALISYNVWMEGELAHPGLMARAQELLNAVGIAWDLATVPRQSHDILCYSNFWVGNQDFWEAYVGGILHPIAKYILDNQSLPLVRRLFDSTVHTTRSPFLPFIIERLFSTYISLNRGIAVASMQLDPYSLALNDMERNLVSNYYELPSVDAEKWAYLNHASRCRQIYNSLLYSVEPHPHLNQNA